MCLFSTVDIVLVLVPLGLLTRPGIAVAAPVIAPVVVASTAFVNRTNDAAPAAHHLLPQRNEAKAATQADQPLCRNTSWLCYDVPS
jgi:hypothetical protein